MNNLALLWFALSVVALGINLYAAKVTGSGVWYAASAIWAITCVVWFRTYMVLSGG